MSKNIAKVFSAELQGIEARLVEVEVDINVGLHSFNIVGLADKALNEAKERVNAALKNSGVKPPNKENRRITVNLAPADLHKTGSQYDLAIGIGYLLATGQVKSFDASRSIFAGELALHGTTRPILGALNIVRMAQRLGFTTVYVPHENAREAALVHGITIIPVPSITALLHHIEERTLLTPASPLAFTPEDVFPVDISEIKGQSAAKRAMLVAAAGGHHLLMSGSPGAGKTMMAQALLSLFPPLSLEEAIEITQIYSAAGILPSHSFLRARPFRSPHHTASPISVIGGGSHPKPGEISLAHHGILFLDELPEFRRDLLESLRQPLESGRVHVARIKHSLTFPARFTLVAAMNPCPCGYYGDEVHTCRCGGFEVIRYQKKISGPLLDRIDIQLSVPRVDLRELRIKKGEVKGDAHNEGNTMRAAVAQARALQAARFTKAKLPLRLNSEMSSKQVEAHSALDASAERFLTSALDSRVSARGYYRILKIARTIADLHASEHVTADHLAEAFQYRVRENN